MDSSEKIVDDLKNSVDESNKNLAELLKKYKIQIKSSKEEIGKQSELNVKKAAEIENLKQQILDLQSKQEFNADSYAKEFHNAQKEIDHNLNILKRQDKLMVDLSQKNDVCHIKLNNNLEKQ